MAFLRSSWIEWVDFLINIYDIILYNICVNILICLNQAVCCSPHLYQSRLVSTGVIFNHHDHPDQFDQMAILIILTILTILTTLAPCSYLLNTLSNLIIVTILIALTILTALIIINMKMITTLITLIKSDEPQSNFLKKLF